MARVSRSSLSACLVLLSGAALVSWGGAFAGVPLTAGRQVNVARAGQAKDGLFTPTVAGLKVLLGDQNLNSIRNYLIKLHGDAQAAVIETHPSEFGQATMSWLFEQADTDGNGTIDKQELKDALHRLGFDWMDEGRVDKLFKKADKDDSESIDLEEFKTTSPKFLQQSLIKLAKKNGADLGFLS
eukprot:TRINITY_DN11895_c0_g1_i10.p1 TRINITY_DN11895_c0_g1~~TRINITY_DN11895_c0_g1_i10.p1  ORF type:complete len:184 (+),score=59.58 TRINITY_DN11895_c0_g1_i10:86-637(+)